MLLKQILDNYPEEPFIIIDGFDDAVIGVDQNAERLVYSINAIVDCLVDEGMGREDAIVNYEYSIARSVPYGDNAPILVYTDFF